MLQSDTAFHISTSTWIHRKFSFITFSLLLSSHELTAPPWTPSLVFASFLGPSATVCQAPASHLGRMGGFALWTLSNLCGLLIATMRAVATMRYVQVLPCVFFLPHNEQRVDIRLSSGKSIHHFINTIMVCIGYWGKWMSQHSPIATV